MPFQSIRYRYETLHGFFVLICAEQQDLNVAGTVCIPWAEARLDYLKN
jgi:hypothetical protein